MSNRIYCKCKSLVHDRLQQPTITHLLAESQRGETVGQEQIVVLKHCGDLGYGFQTKIN